MAKFPWRFQGDIATDNVDPMTTCFMGPERAVLDDDGKPTGATFIEQDTSDPVTLPFSQFAAALKAGTLDKLRKDAKKKGPPNASPL